MPADGAGGKPVLREVRDTGTVEMPIVDLLPANSPRLTEDDDHIQVLSETDTELPPILVHRNTLQVIDGMHRLRAAQRRGDTAIAVRYFDGDEREAFVQAVRLNSEHGLPLTLADRKNAALRIMNYHPEWSDRAIAALVGISDKTVGAIRRREGDNLPRPTARIGRDNESHPLNSRQGRLRASEIFQQNPHATTREVAKLAQISATTAKDVRNRLLRGEDPVPPKQRGAAAPSAPAAPRTPAGATPPTRRPPAVALSRLRTDPSLRFSETGRTLLRWLEALGNQPDEWLAVAQSVPAHCAPAIVEMARQRAEDWHNFASALDQRIRAIS
ncbi:ParB/RepB/Spo0J family partition protein [Actinomadura opuntiae]|uniref:ParB/RepB/Spo0J family partition protein n=1 Tax=Actinomadura sp. OS1-43 TaxID=604315 RepID=UPI00255AE73F|nr:ParB N-terminal domain-containing protein [Actinomadura sp. OS1-43]MDL4818691.1 ParB N-terminal domain-containing protein [Actinomadura sp. OS1-43]